MVWYQSDPGCISLLQHHDAVTGTERSLVLDNYVNMLNIAMDSCKNTFSGDGEHVLYNSLSWSVLGIKPFGTCNILEEADSVETRGVPQLKIQHWKDTKILDYTEMFLSNKNIEVRYVENQDSASDEIG